MSPEQAQADLDAALAARDLAAAASALDALTRAAQHDANAWNNLGALRLELGEIDAALAAYAEAARRAPEQPAVHYNRGLALKRAGRLDDALAAYDRALALAPDNPHVLSNLGAALLDLGRPGQAYPLLQRASERGPSLLPAWFNLGVAAGRIRQWDAAADAFAAVLRLDPTHLEALHEYGEATLNAGRTEEARRALVRTIEQRLDAGPGPWRTIAPGPPSTVSLPADAARAALFAVTDALARVGLRPVLSGGTALGCIREGGFIAHDGDIDLALLPGADLAALARAFDGHADLQVRFTEHLEDALLRVVVDHRDGVTTDVFPYHVAEDCWWFGIRRGDTALCWWDEPYTPVSRQFLGREFLVPSPPERYLEHNYGPDWRIPNAFHIAGFSAENIVNPYASFPRGIGYVHLSRSLRDGRLDAAHYFAGIAARRDPADALIARVLAALPPLAAAEPQS